MAVERHFFKRNGSNLSGRHALVWKFMKQGVEIGGDHWAFDDEKQNWYFHEVNVTPNGQRLERHRVYCMQPMPPTKQQNLETMGEGLKLYLDSTGRFVLLLIKECMCVSHSVMSNSLRPYGLYSARLLCPWDFPGKNIGVGCHFLLQRTFSTQGSNPGLCIADSLFTVWTTGGDSRKIKASIWSILDFLSQ